jgi:hypothetical protein
MGGSAIREAGAASHPQYSSPSLSSWYSVTTLIRKKIKFFSYIKEIPKGAVAKSYMTNGLLVFG